MHGPIAVAGKAGDAMCNSGKIRRWHREMAGFYVKRNIRENELGWICVTNLLSSDG
jgi:hypothetical protein